MNSVMEVILRDSLGRSVRQQALIIFRHWYLRVEASVQVTDCCLIWDLRCILRREV
jgi:hypothetical protein